ncbi:MAG TPA: MarR family transcriptional regulator [Thermoleophilaceae bacterium]|jgi:DNA-binding MarR family transcriptional regulator
MATASKTASPRSSPAAEAWGLLLQLFFAHHRPRLIELGQELDLAPQQLLALKMLDEPRPMSALAGALMCDNSNVTGIVDRLETRGLVERQPSPLDRRVKLLVLTGEGRRVRELITARMTSPPPPIAELSAKDQRELRDLLRRALGGA